MTIQGAINELVNLLKADDIPIYYKGGIKKVIETIDDYIDGKDDYVKRKTEPLPKTINGVRIADAVTWADKWLEDNPISEMWDMIRTLRDATEWQNEPQTERSE